MKKASTFLLFMFIPYLLGAQWYGDGLTPSTAYYGIVNSSYPMQTWNSLNYPSGIIYIGRASAEQNDFEIGNGGVLNIDEGMTIKFCINSSDLKITGTGILNAIGNSSNYITLTRDAQPTWGHITFESLHTGTSVIQYCIIEHGYKNGSGSDGYGGGIHIQSNVVSIENSIIRNNYALFGGGIFVNKSVSPIIRNCYFYQNQASRAGGGLYSWSGASPSITNCIFDSNVSLETVYPNYSGGGIATGTSATLQVLNCTFVNNNSLQPEGKSITLDRSPNSKVINSIFWGSDEKQIFCYGTSSGSSFINCSYRGITYTNGSPISSLLLNSDNTAIDGPNFADPGNNNWSLTYVSPCKDSGTDSYGTPNIVPATDYDGNPRVYITDMGAYEYQYSRWKTNASSTDWNTAANWHGGTPTSSRDVIIPTGGTNYPTSTPGPDFTIGAGKKLLVEHGARVTFDDLTNNGRIKMLSNSGGFASMILNSYTRGAGAVEDIELFLTGGGSELLEDYKWHYISTPVNTISTDIFTTVTPDLAQFIESRPSTTLLQGWVAYDGYAYANGAMTGITFNSLSPGKGYNYFDYSDHTYTFGGLFNTSDLAVNLAYSGTPATLHGFNLLGNPFSSGLSWNDIINNTYFPYPANTSKGLYFTRDNLQCSYIGGVGIPGDVTGIIPPMQGFFIKTTSAGNTITIPAAARTHSNIHATYKGDEIIPLVRLAVFENTVSNDETVVRFDDAAKSELDNDFDAIKMFLSSTKTSIHTSYSGTNFAINGLPFPEIETTTEIPVVVNVTTTGNHKITASQLQGLDAYGVTLTDNVTGFTADLKTNPEVTFNSPAGTLASRFILKVGNITTGSETPEAEKGIFSIYQGYGYINIMPLAGEWSGQTGSIRIMDLAGKTVATLSESQFNRNSVIQIAEPKGKGMYVVEIKAGARRFVGKVVVR